MTATDSSALAPLPPGTVLGDYTVVRPLGSGGMGTVYEADVRSDGRRVALKVLSHALEGEEHRARFLREGTLAASLNHPNTIYVYGTEEIQGRLVIAMELAATGSLADRLAERGPLPVPEAVAAILQVLDGLEAAHSLGILHRDLKPSNCFVAADGTVKVGDFGLSISAASRPDSRLTAAGMFLGTPAYSPPEQLGGESLDVRSDLYAVGVTLYELLSGKLPFPGLTPIQQITAILDKPPAPLAAHRPDVPEELVRAIERCLAKRSEARYQSCAELREDLAPFARRGETPAPLGRRLVAGIADQLVLTALRSMETLGVAVQAGFEGMTGAGAGLLGWITMLLYFGLSEGRWGTTPGKFLLGLRVHRTGGGRPGLARGLVRGFVFSGGALALAIGLAAGVRQQSPAVIGLGLLQNLWPFLLFATARWRNGWAAVHDLLSGCRVILTPAPVWSRRVGQQQGAVRVEELGDRTIGPYRVSGRIERDEAGEWLVGVDERLGRSVWVRVHAAGAVSAADRPREAYRAGRLRWLTGRRGGDESWDAYEAPSGATFLAVAAGAAQPWGRVRSWLLDLARELRAAELEGTLPGRLGLRHLWVAEDDRLLLLDFPGPGTTTVETLPAGDRFTPVALLAAAAEVAVRAAGAPPTEPPPRHATEFLARLRAEPPLEAVVRDLEALMAQPVVVSRRRRLGALAVAGAPAGLFLAGVVFATTMSSQLTRSDPELFAALAWAERYVELDSAVLTPRQGADSAAPLAAGVRFAVRNDTIEARSAGDLPIVARRREAPGTAPESLFPELALTGTAFRDALETYIAGRFGPYVRDTLKWQGVAASGLIVGEERQALDAIVARRGVVDSAELARAAALMAGQPVEERFGVPVGSFVGALAMVWIALFPVAVVALLLALVGRTGLAFRAANLAVVTAAGDRPSRWRLIARAAVTWAPMLVFVAADSLPRPVRYALVAVFAAGVAWVLVRPGQGLQDRVAGTRVVCA